MDQTPFLVGFVIMSLASIAIYARGSKEPGLRSHTYFHATVPFIAATAYLAMTFDLGDVLKPDGTVTLVARYIDWSITTPILLTGLVMVALHERREASGFLVAIITLDVLMILTGLISSLAAIPAAYAPGETATVIATPVGALGLSICYDLRFPALYQALGEAGATILSIPAAFTRPTGMAHWHTLLRARAIESSAFVVAAAQTGEHEDGRTTYGHSLVVDPWGEVLLDMGEKPGVAVVEIDPARVDVVRARIPVLAHRRTIPPVSVIR